MLVQQVRSRIHDDIQSLHGTMPLWGVDRWVPLGDLFVDVNILEQVSSNSRAELDDLLQDFTTGNSNYRSLDRIGLGKEQRRVSGLAVLERNTNLMVVGKPGSGKTTYLQRIVTECNDGKLQAQRIPVLIKLREFVDDGRKYAYNLEQFLGQLWRLSNAEIELVLNQGRVLVLLDGLDEVTGEAGKQIANEIKRFARAYSQVQVVVTCRTQSQVSRFERFDYVEVADFNEEQVRVFAAHWFRTVCADAGDTKAREFLEQLFREENKAIRELAITPILLSLTCAVFHRTGKFYSKRSKLYEEGLELLLVQWDKSRSVERDEIYRDLSVERKLELLNYVAVKKFEQEQYVLFEQEELEGYIGEFLGIERRDSRGVLRAIASQHGLLIERSQKVWSFSHLTFQEYLVARCFSNRKDWQEMLHYFIIPYWEQVFLISAEIHPDCDCFLKGIYHKTHELAKNEENIQKLLTWVDEKATSICKNQGVASTILRAFYFSHTLGFDFDLVYILDWQSYDKTSGIIMIDKGDI
ncbi:NACHT domain-containing NTPase [Aulosira sp. FACHB-615]|uniref:NACHT domain-containing protein n=1 Tax=Aulosira sp. FACHB-615 TaxID=2692777 RepID=UPI00168303A8|nr:NACHT domain-containing protein [Aulosira sp. FACHB-615]MBD2491358.1 NACHT domain-containing protein [Aulosira sp. FACHB-615]